MAQKGRISPVTRFVRELEGGPWMTLAEVARALRIPEDTLRTWRRDDPANFNPSFMTHFGDLPVYCYSLDDLERVRAAAATHTSGRGQPRLWSVAEAKDRQRRHVRARYWERRAALLTERGDRAKAREAARNSRVIRHDLAVQAGERRQRLGLT